jgi:MYXO-CTERM domain-containing protein
MATRLASILGVLLAAALLTPAAALLAPATALADGDPASDTLLGENVFYPYTPPVAASAQRSLNAETAAAKKAGFPLKVALIAGPTDLGVIPDLFGQPQKYADFLDQEISFQRRQPLLVVMPAGYGLQGVSQPAKDAARSLHPPAGKTSTDLAQAAVIAVATLAAASGHPLKNVPGTSHPAGSGGSSSTPLVVGLAVAALLVAGALVALRRRKAPVS